MMCTMAAFSEMYNTDIFMRKSVLYGKVMKETNPSIGVIGGRIVVFTAPF